MRKQGLCLLQLTGTLSLKHAELYLLHDHSELTDGKSHIDLMNTFSTLQREASRNTFF